MSWIPFNPRASKYFINVNFPNKYVRLKHNHPFPPNCLDTSNTKTLRNHTPGLRASLLQNGIRFAQLLAFSAALIPCEECAVFYFSLLYPDN